jgi:hypothetical protein
MDISDPDLIVGDHPVMLADLGSEDVRPGALGICNPHIEVLMPLSRRMVALAHWDGETAYARLARGMTANFNERTLRYTRRFVFASSDSNELLAQAMRLRGYGPGVLVRRIKAGGKLIIQNEYR